MKYSNTFVPRLKCLCVCVCVLLCAGNVAAVAMECVLVEEERGPNPKRKVATKRPVHIYRTSVAFQFRAPT